MRRISLAHLQTASIDRPVGYSEDVISRGKIEGAVLVLEESVYRELWEKYGGKPIRREFQSQSVAVVQSIPRKDWPWWTKALALIAKSEDKGIGDVVVRTIGPTNSDAFKKWYKRIFGEDCGCSRREIEWNQKYPLNNG